MAEEAEQPENEPFDEEQARAALQFWQNAIMAAYEHGVMYLETWICHEPKCRRGQFVVHSGKSEVLACQFCNTRHITKITRPPAIGEVTKGHYETALQIMRDTAAETLKDELKPVLPEVIAALPKEMRLMFEAHKHQMMKYASEKAHKLANAMAEAGLT